MWFWQVRSLYSDTIIPEDCQITKNKSQSLCCIQTCRATCGLLLIVSLALFPIILPFFSLVRLHWLHSSFLTDQTLHFLASAWTVLPSESFVACSVTFFVFYRRLSLATYLNTTPTPLLQQKSQSPLTCSFSPPHKTFNYWNFVCLLRICLWPTPSMRSSP